MEVEEAESGRLIPKARRRFLRLARRDADRRAARRIARRREEASLQRSRRRACPRPAPAADGAAGAAPRLQEHRRGGWCSVGAACLERVADEWAPPPPSREAGRRAVRAVLERVMSSSTKRTRCRSDRCATRAGSVPTVDLSKKADWKSLSARSPPTSRRSSSRYSPPSAARRRPAEPKAAEAIEFSAAAFASSSSTAWFCAPRFACTRRRRAGRRRADVRAALVGANEVRGGMVAPAAIDGVRRGSRCQGAAAAVDPAEPSPSRARSRAAARSRLSRRPTPSPEHPQWDHRRRS